MIPPLLQSQLANQTPSPFHGYFLDPRGGLGQAGRKNFRGLVLGSIKSNFCKLILNTHLKALAEIYTIHTFVQISDFTISLENCQTFLQNSEIVGLTARFFEAKNSFVVVETGNFYTESRIF